MTIKASSSSRVEEIWDVLREEILRGQYRPGERLPSERDLAARFGANRGAVREALKKLEQIGIADITPGGVRVVPVEDATLDVLGYILSQHEFPDPALIGQVFEVLGALMSMSARTAVRAASDEQLEQMRERVAALMAVQDNREREAELWAELGRQFTEANNNLVLRLILNGLKTQFVGRLKASTESDVRLDAERNRQILETLADQLVRRDADAVAAAISDHFEHIRETVLAALSRLSDTNRSISHG